MLRRLSFSVLLIFVCVCVNAQSRNQKVTDINKLETRYVDNCFVVDNCKVTLHDFNSFFKSHPEYKVISKTTYSVYEFGLDETYVTSFRYSLAQQGGAGNGASIELGKAIGIGLGIVELGLLGSLFLKTLKTSGSSCQITLLAEPDYGGTVRSDYMFYKVGETCTVKATSSNGHRFLYWSEDGVEVSRNAYYQFTVTRNRTLKAHFN